MYSNMNIEIGSAIVTKSPGEITDPGGSFRNQSLSDHLCLYTQLNFEPMISKRTPAIHKMNMIKRLKKINY